MSFHANIYKQRSALVALYDSRWATGILLTKGRHTKGLSILYAVTIRKFKKQTDTGRQEEEGMWNEYWRGSGNVSFPPETRLKLKGEI